MDLNSQRCKLIPVKSIGDRALFLSGDRCLSVSASDLPSLSSNSIYSTLPQYPVLVLSLGTGLSERLADSCQIHDGKERIRPSVRPFTIADHLITYCNPREWSNGLMFHEYHYIPLYTSIFRGTDQEYKGTREGTAGSTHRFSFALKEQTPCFTLLTELKRHAHIVIVGRETRASTPATERHWMWICGGAVVLTSSSSSRLHAWRRSSRHGVLQERITPKGTTPRRWPWIKLLRLGAGACDGRRGEAGAEEKHGPGSAWERLDDGCAEDERLGPG